MDVAGMLLLLSITYTLHQVDTDIKIAKVATMMVVLVKIIMYMIKMEAKCNETGGYKNESGEGEQSGGGESGENVDNMQTEKMKAMEMMRLKMEVMMMMMVVWWR